MGTATDVDTSKAAARMARFNTNPVTRGNPGDFDSDNEPAGTSYRRVADRTENHPGELDSDREPEPGALDSDNDHDSGGQDDAITIPDDDKRDLSHVNTRRRKTDVFPQAEYTHNNTKGVIRIAIEHTNGSDDVLLEASNPAEFCSSVNTYSAD